MRSVDFLVIGSGIAGLSFALKVANYGKVLIVTKASEEESNTKYAQGGVAVVFFDRYRFFTISSVCRTESFFETIA